MAIDSTRAFFQHITGKWSGTYKLWMDPDRDPEDSPTTASIQFVAVRNYVVFTYTWVQGGEGQEGVFLLGGDKNTATATWGDSWHMEPQPMVCKGTLQDDGRNLVLNGDYPAGDETWGWRTEISHDGADSLVMKAFNISPNGKEDLAVQSEMMRL